MSIYIECESQLRKGLEQLSVAIDEAAILRLVEYLKAFDKWNKAYNLSAVRDPLEMVHRHLLDSLALVPILQQALAAGKVNYLLDVGTGGGLPGIPLAIACPHLPVTLLDSNGKKTRFLFQIKIELGLGNVTVVHSRAEQYQPEQRFSVIVSRAFASLSDMVNCTEHLLAPAGKFWAMKGIYPKDELSELAKHYKVEDSYPLSIPQSEGERHLLVISQAV